MPVLALNGLSATVSGYLGQRVNLILPSSSYPELELWIDDTFQRIPSDPIELDDFTPFGSVALKGTKSLRRFEWIFNQKVSYQMMRLLTDKLIPQSQKRFKDFSSGFLTLQDKTTPVNQISGLTPNYNWIGVPSVDSDGDSFGYAAFNVFLQLINSTPKQLGQDLWGVEFRAVEIHN